MIFTKLNYPNLIICHLKPEPLLLQKQNKTLDSSTITDCLLCAWYCRRLEYIHTEFEFYYENSDKYKYKHIRKHTNSVIWEYNEVTQRIKIKKTRYLCLK